MSWFENNHIDFVRVASLQYRVGPFRAVIAIMLGVFSIIPLGLKLALGWTIAMVVCEAWHWFAGRPAGNGQMSRPQMIHYLIAGSFTVPCWTMLGGLYWISGMQENAAIALVLWAAQLINTQRFIYQSEVAILVGNFSTVAAMLIVPIIDPRFSFEIQATISFGLLLSIIFAFSGAWMNMSNVRSLMNEKQAVEHIAAHDSLTGLANRSQFMKGLETVLGNTQNLAVMFLDLDRFKQVNDSLGHKAGDELLIEYSQRALRLLPSDATIARLGGDEFAILLPIDTSRVQTEEICSRLVEAAREKFGLPSGSAYVGVSIGVALAPEHGMSAESLLRKADLALYDAKASGRGTFRIFDAELEAVLSKRVHLEGQLRQALHTGSGIVLNFQPILNSRQELVGVESLLRWSDETYGSVEPELIISIAEEAGLIASLTDWVVDRAFAMAANLREMRVSINISPSQFAVPEFSQNLIAKAVDAGIALHRIELEITETVFLNTSEEVMSAIDELRSAGVTIVLDDFGRGYSSLSHLQSLKIDRFKIDKTFVQRVTSDESALAIVQSITKLGQVLNLQVTAEGVESVQQFDMLKLAGVDCFQGFLFSRAVPEVELQTLRQKFPMVQARNGPGEWARKVAAA